MLLRDCEVRPCWRSASGVVLESLVVGGPCGREISVTLAASQRRRDALQSLGI